MKNFGLAPVKAEGAEVPFDKMSVREGKPETPPVTHTLSHKADWYSYPPNPTTKYVCECGSDNFQVHYIHNGYETSVRCVDCDEVYIVHEG